MQLQKLSKAMSYNDLVLALNKNLQIIVQAYATGSNAMLFRGFPGMPGVSGARGASMLRLTKADFAAAYDVIGDLTNFDSIYDSKPDMLTALNLVLGSSVATDILLTNVDGVTYETMTNGDMFVFDNARITFVFQDNAVWSATYTFSNDLLTTVTGMSRTEIEALVADTVAGQSSALKTIYGLLVPGEFDTTLPAFPELQEIYPILIESIIYSYFESEAQTVFLLGNRNGLADLFSKLNIDQYMYGTDLLAQVPKCIMLQEGSKYGMLFLDPNNITENISLSAFANVRQVGNKLVMSSHCDDSELGHIKISKEVIDLMSTETVLHGLAKFLSHKNSKSLGVDNEGDTYDSSELFVQSVVFDITNTITEPSYEPEFGILTLPGKYANPEQITFDALSFALTDDQGDDANNSYTGLEHMTLSIRFAGNGEAKTVARSDHDHDEVYEVKGAALIVGMQCWWPGRVLPDATFMVCSGQAMSKTTYPALFNVLGYDYGGSGDTFNLPNVPPLASPVQADTIAIGYTFSLTNAGLGYGIGDQITFDNKISITVDQVQVDGAITEYTIDNAVGVITLGSDYIVSSQQAQNTVDAVIHCDSVTTAANVGVTGGEASHTLTQAETPLKAHTHPVTYQRAYQRTESPTEAGSGSYGIQVSAIQNDTINTGSTSSTIATAHNNMPPYVSMQFIIKVTQGL
jgi:microcystin-dependent protein